VFLEILQAAPIGGSTELAWASAHLYDPASAAEVTEGAVSLEAGGASYPMPYGTNAGGTKSFNVTLPSGTAGGTSFTITTTYTELGKAPVRWSLVGQPASFTGSITSPSGPVHTGDAMTVRWTSQPKADYSQTQLFFEQGGKYLSRYASPTVNSPEVTSETVPGSDLATAGQYLLNLDYASATCPASSAGCVYDLSTAALNVTVK
jgi:hypothetical protein